MGAVIELQIQHNFIRPVRVKWHLIHGNQKKYFSRLQIISSMITIISKINITILTITTIFTMSAKTWKVLRKRGVLLLLISSVRPKNTGPSSARFLT
jgi:hypothetical protein